MARFKAWVTTWKVGSTCEDEFEIDDEELEGLDETERLNFIDQVAKDQIVGLYDWGWEEISDDD